MQWIMTMNDYNQPAGLLGPLDLRTTDRECVSSGSRTPDRKAPCRNRWPTTTTTTTTTTITTITEAAAVAATQGDVPLELLVDGVRSAPDRHHLTSVSTSDCAHARHSVVVRDARSSESDALDGRRSDKSSSSLPFRKRRFPAEQEISSRLPVPPGGGNGSTPVEKRDLSPLPKRCLQGPANGNDIQRCAAEAAHRNAHGYHRLMQTCIPCQRPWVYPGCCFSLVPLTHPFLPQAHLSEPPLPAEVALATIQDDDGDTALHIAVVQGEENIVSSLISLLLLARRDLNIYNNLRQTPLHLAVITHQAGMVEALLKAGANPSILDRNGQTALHLCCEHGQQDCLTLVLSYLTSPACLDLRNFEGLSPLHLAVQGGWKDLAKMLLDAGADINAMDNKSGQSPIIHAVESNNIDMVRFLIEHGCDVNSQTYSGNTALHSACGRGQMDTVRVLLKNGADSTLKNYHNDTPVMVAKDKKITDVLRGKVFKQTKSQDQPCLSVSTQRSNLRTHESPSPSHSL